MYLVSVCMLVYLFLYKSYVYVWVNLDIGVDR